MSELQSSFRILTVCTGNLCRSPLAEQLLSQQLRHVPEISISSVGTHALVGQQMPELAQENARSFGIENPELHRARAMTAESLDSSDLILAMSREHRRAIVELNPRALRKVFTVREFGRLAERTTDNDLRSELAGKTATPLELLRAATRGVTNARGSVPPLNSPTDDDVIDPYQRSKKTYNVSTWQLLPALDATTDLLLRALAGVS
ncbi:arsenate reductase/protein-tyrosine-phosphatase family protein [Corynebacterium sp. A21]|uniref:arsenate reductase/protein-tyrosine-phosphatase family protein n=1 Tax=Corynebacterium sp. A21 TaxID=3457318 RepID=UPI003FD5666E